MSFISPSLPTAIYLFNFIVKAKTTKAGIKASLPTVKRCEDFAEALGIYCSADVFNAYDGILPVRLVFKIEAPEDVILTQVATLFNFAAALKLTLINQFFYPKQTI